MRIGVLGAGAWGTALAVNASARNEVMLWGRDPAQLERMREQARNERYLLEVPLPARLALTARRDDALAFAQGGLLIVAIARSTILPRSAACLSAAAAHQDCVNVALTDKGSVPWRHGDGQRVASTIAAAGAAEPAAGRGRG